MNPSIQKSIEKFLFKCSPVSLIHNNENGDWVWAVSVNEDPEFWLDAFPTKEEAVKYCNKHTLPVTEYIDQKTGQTTYGFQK
jgi:hypothetical protein